MPQPQCKHLLKNLAYFSKYARNRCSNLPRSSAYDGAADFACTDPGNNKLLACSCLQDFCSKKKNQAGIYACMQLPTDAMQSTAYGFIRLPS